MRFLDHWFDYFLPSACLSCRTVLSFEENHLCESCNEKLEFLKEPFCILCGDPFSNSFIDSHHCQNCLKNSPPFEVARSMFLFEETLSKMIYSFKYHGSEAILPWFREVFAEWISQNNLANDFDWIVPVPLHPFRLIRRGYNQSLLLSKEIGKILKVQIDYENLIRKNYEKPQSLKSREKRKREIRNVFVLKNEKVFKNKKILLVDDVYTTGSTAKECSRVLKKGGAEIYLFTLARTPLLY